MNEKQAQEIQEWRDKMEDRLDEGHEEHRRLWTQLRRNNVATAISLGLVLALAFGGTWATFKLHGATQRNSVYLQANREFLERQWTLLEAIQSRVQKNAPILERVLGLLPIGR